MSVLSVFLAFNVRFVHFVRFCVRFVRYVRFVRVRLGFYRDTDKTDNVTPPITLDSKNFVFENNFTENNFTENFRQKSKILQFVVKKFVC